MKYKQIKYFYLVVILILMSCKQEVTKNWKLDSYSFNIDFPIDYLLIDENKAIIIDNKAIKYNFQYQVSNKKLILENQFQKIALKINKIDEESIQLDSLKFSSILEEKGLFSIDLLEVETNKAFSNSTDKVIISVKPNIENQLQFKFGYGNQIAKIDEIPLYMTCIHCNPPKEVILILDKKVTYQNLKEIYYWLEISGTRKVGLITKSNLIGHYVGFYEKINIWDEDMEIFFANLNNPPTYPPLNSRRNYLASLNNVVQLNITSTENIKELDFFLEEGKENILIKIDKITSIEEYVKIKLDVIQLVDKLKERKALKKFESSYKELTLNQKKILSKDLPTIKFEMRI